MRFLILAFVALLFTSAPVRAAGDEGIAAVVNQDAISMTDLRDRTKLIIISSGMPDTPEIRAKLLPQIMSGLIEEQLMMQEAERRKITVSTGEIDQGFATLAQRNNIPPDKFAAAIKSSGINPATMRRQIEAQTAWLKFVKKSLEKQVVVSDSDIDEYLARVNQNKGKEEYLLAEIMLPVEASTQDSEVRQIAENLSKEIRANKAPFFKVAQQFSKAPGAQQGGDMGWMQKEQLPAELANILPNLKPNDVSDPVRTAEGYHIWLLREKRVVTDENIPTREVVGTIIGTQRLERLQRRYMMDLKSTAFIDNRVQS